jgi:hypothetical protein
MHGGCDHGIRNQRHLSYLRVSLPDPSHVLIEGGNPEFYCGAEDGRKVTIQYVAKPDQDGKEGILRGMHFESAASQ